MIVEFEHSNETRSCLGEAQTKEEAWKLINDFLAKCDYKAPYFRVNPIWEEHRIWIDAGSHTEFFYICGLTDEEMKEFFK